jgi:hypothetical protein
MSTRSAQRLTEMLTSRLTGDRFTNRRRSESPAPEGVFCHAARGRDERKGRPAPTRLPGRGAIF